jgi:hypothetical protein
MPGATQAERQAAIDTIGGVVIGGMAYANDGEYYVRIAGDSTGEAVTKASDLLESLPQVYAAWPIIVPTGDEFGGLLPSDAGDFAKWVLRPDSFGTGLNWGLEAINAPLAWGCEIGSGQRVDIVDVGFHRAQAGDVNPNIKEVHWAPQMPLNNSTQHGLRVASVLAARGDNNSGMTGVLWDADLHLWDASRQLAGHAILNGGKPWPTEVGKRFKEAMADGAQIINLSIGVYHGDDALARIRTNSATRADSARVEKFAKQFFPKFYQFWLIGRRPLVVFAAGNDTIDAWWSGAALVKERWPDRVLIVGAAARAPTGSPGDNGTGMTLAPFSNHGPHLDIVAPGAQIGVFDAVQQQPIPYSGTSYAAPMVAGVAALLKAFDPSLTAAELKALILAGADSAARYLNNRGQPVRFLDAYQALRLAARRTGAPLCGNRVWAIGKNVYAERAPGAAAELLFSVPDSIESLSVFHGGKRILADWRDYRYGSNGWTEVPYDTPVRPGEDLPSFAEWWDMTHEAEMGAYVWRSVDDDYSVMWEVTLSDWVNDWLLASFRVPPQPSSPTCTMKYNGTCTFEIDLTWLEPGHPNHIEVAEAAFSPFGDTVYVAIPTAVNEYQTLIPFGPCNAIWSQPECATAIIRRTIEKTTVYAISVSDGGTREAFVIPGRAVFAMGFSDAGDELVVYTGMWDVVWQWFGDRPHYTGDSTASWSCRVEYRRRSAPETPVFTVDVGGYNCSSWERGFGWTPPGSIAPSVAIPMSAMDRLRQGPRTR